VAIDYQRLEKYLSREFRQYHVTAQVYRACGVFLGVLAAQLATGWHDWTWKGLIALVAAAGYVTVLQLFPTVPWKKFLGHVQVAQAVEARQIADAAVAYSADPAPAKQAYTPVTQPAVADSASATPDPPTGDPT
jgi:hypothetical protein